MGDVHELHYDRAEVSAQDAYEAAVERAGRTQHALVLAEAQILAWKRRYAEQVRRIEQLEAEVSALGGRTKVDEGVEHGQDAGAAEDAAGGGEADCA